MKTCIRFLIAAVVGLTIGQGALGGPLSLNRCASTDGIAPEVCGSVVVDLDGGDVVVRLRNLDGVVPSVDPQRWWRGINLIDLTYAGSGPSIFGSPRTISTPNAGGPADAQLTLVGDAVALGDLSTITPFVSVQGSKLVVQIPNLGGDRRPLSSGVVGCNHNPHDPLTGLSNGIETCGLNAWVEIRFDQPGGAWTLDDIGYDGWAGFLITSPNSAQGQDCTRLDRCYDIDPGNPLTFAPPAPPTHVGAPTTVLMLGVWGVLGVSIRKRLKGTTMFQFEVSRKQALS